MISEHSSSTPLDIKGLLTLLSLFSALFGAFSCFAQEEKPQDVLTFGVHEHKAMPDIANIQRIRFLTTLDFPPFNFLGEEGRLSGFNVDLARELCDDLKVQAKCQIQAMPFDELKKALETKTGDAVIAGVAASEELRTQFDFTRPYLQLPARFLARKQGLDGAPDAETLNKKKVGVIKNSAHEAMFKAYFPSLQPTEFNDREAMLTALAKGDVDVVFYDGMRLAFWKDSKDSDECCAFWGGPYYSTFFLGTGMRIMTRKSDQLSGAFDHGLLDLAKDGKLSNLFVKYLPAGLY